MEVEVIGIDVQAHPILTLAPAATRAKPDPPIQVLLLTAPNRTIAISAVDQRSLRG